MTVTRAQFQLLLEPKLRNIWNDGWPPRPLEYSRFVNISASRKAQETDYKMTGLGAMQDKTEGGLVTYGDPVLRAAIAAEQAASNCRPLMVAMLAAELERKKGHDCEKHARLIEHEPTLTSRYRCTVCSYVIPTDGEEGADA